MKNPIPKMKNTQKSKHNVWFKQNIAVNAWQLEKQVVCLRHATIQ